MKHILKSMLIVALLFIAICFILCVMFYQYIPFNKVVPSNVQKYQTSTTVSEILDSEVSGVQMQNITMEMTPQDVSTYLSARTYTAGKANPFEYYNEYLEDGSKARGYYTNTYSPTGNNEAFYNAEALTQGGYAIIPANATDTTSGTTTTSSGSDSSNHFYNRNSTK